MALKGGPKEVAKMLNKMTLQERERLMREITQRDPRLAEEIKASMLSFEDLQTITVKMFQELLREISLADLALALRLGSIALREHLRGMVSERLAKEIDEVLLGPPRPVSEVEEALGRVMQVVVAKVDKGELVLGDDETLV